MRWLIGWLKKVISLEEDQPVADVMTDKALVQIPAMYAGKVVKLHYAKGEIAKVHRAAYLPLKGLVTAVVSELSLSFRKL